MKFWVKEHTIVYRGQLEKILAFCDEDLLGKELTDGNLKIKIDPRFYKEKLVEETTLIELIKKHRIINAFGINSVNVLKKLGLVKDSGIKFISGMPHAIVVLMYI